VVLRAYKEGEQADTSQQGSKAPKNPLTGQRLTPISSEKEGYQATEVNVGESEKLSGRGDIRINQQLGAQPGGRSFGGESPQGVLSTSEGVLPTCYSFS
jgi:hypothetical protein